MKAARIVPVVVAVTAAAVVLGTGAARATDAPADPSTNDTGSGAVRTRDAWAEISPGPAPPTTTTTTTTQPPPGSSRIADDILIGIALEIRNFAPPAWAASEESALRARLDATDLSRAVSAGGALSDDRAPLTGVSGSFTRPEPSIRPQFAPAAMLGAILAWALITGFEKRRKRGPASAAR